MTGFVVHYLFIISSQLHEKKSELWDMNFKKSLYVR